MASGFSDFRAFSSLYSYGVSYSVILPGFPVGFSADFPLQVVIQCSGCFASGTGADSDTACLTVGTSVDSPCNQLEICDTNAHTCTIALPISSVPTGLAINVSPYDNCQTTTNDPQPCQLSFQYSLTMQAFCPGGGIIDYTLCEPVLGKETYWYPTMCVFSHGSETTVGINGCSCLAAGSGDYSCSTCWNGMLPSSCDLGTGIQDCQHVCPSLPSASSSITATPTPTTSLSVSPSSLPSFASTPTPMPSLLMSSSCSSTATPSRRILPPTSTATQAQQHVVGYVLSGLLGFVISILILTLVVFLFRQHALLLLQRLNRSSLMPSSQFESHVKQSPLLRGIGDVDDPSGGAYYY